MQSLKLVFRAFVSSGTEQYRNRLELLLQSSIRRHVAVLDVGDYDVQQLYKLQEGFPSLTFLSIDNFFNLFQHILGREIRTRRLFVSST
jgi:hypothetical protein